MNIQVKQRLIGGLVLVAIVAFGLPFFLHRSQPTSQNSNNDSSNTTSPQVELALPNTPATTPASSDTTSMNASSPTVSVDAPAPVANSPEPSSPVASQTMTPAPASDTAVSQMSSVAPASTVEPSSVVAANPANSSAIPAPANNSVSTAQSQALPLPTQQTQSASDSNAIQQNKVNTESQNQTQQQQAQQQDGQPQAIQAPMPTAQTQRPSVESTPVKAERAAQHSIHSTNKGWLLQVAALSDPEHARLLLKKMEAKGIHAYTQKEKRPSGRTLIRVLVGPEAQLDQAQLLQHKINKEFNLRSVIRRET
jgi:cell division septation protein DedD